MSVRKTTHDLSDMQWGLGIGCTVAISLMIISWGVIIKELCELYIERIQLNPTPAQPSSTPATIPMPPALAPELLRPTTSPPPYMPPQQPLIAPQSNVRPSTPPSRTDSYEEPPPDYGSLFPRPSGNVSHAGYNQSTSNAIVPLPEVIISTIVGAPIASMPCTGTQR